ncbi:MAG: hypothetical protein WDM87_03835 [Terracidiphilus sp.]
MALEQNAIDQLTEALRFRRIEEGITRLEGMADDLEQVGIAMPNPGSLMVLVAQWIDAGFRDARFLADLLDRFSGAFRKEMPTDQYLQLCIGGRISRTRQSAKR